MKIPIEIPAMLFKIDLILLYFTNLFLDIFDSVRPFGHLRLISYGGSGLALIFGFVFKL